MQGVLEVPEELAPLALELARGLSRVEEAFEAQLASDLPPVAELVRHIETYRGKMLRPTLVLLCGAATHPGAGASPAGPTEMGRPGAMVDQRHVLAGAVVEMVHMATLVHDDVLDEAEVRRAGRTVNRLRGNEAAVILGDYLIASAYHLCSTLPTPEAALAVGRASMLTCAGELLQLHHRDDLSLDEATYREIVRLKTGELIAVSAELGAICSSASEPARKAVQTFAREVGVAFQIQDDLLDLTSTQSKLGKPVGQDVAKGKLTLPIILHLARVAPARRGETLALLERAARANAAPGTLAQLRDEVVASGAVEAARATAQRAVADAKAALGVLPASPARAMLELMADAVVRRAK